MSPVNDEVVFEVVGYIEPGALTSSGNPQQARIPKGSESGGQWIDTPGGLLRRSDAIDASGNKRQYGLKRQSVEDYHAKSPYAPAFAPLDDYDREALADLTRESLQEAVDSGVKVQVSMNALEQIVADGRFRTLEELEGAGKSPKNAYYGLARSMYEADIMGVPAPNLRPSNERPVYGYGIEDDFGRPTQSYGDVTVHLKDSVLPRTTWTVGDSLDRQIRPLWSDEIGTADRDTLLASSHWAIAGDVPLRVSDYWTDGPMEHIEYVEAQVHGGVSWSDIDSIEVDDITQVPADLADYARDSGVSLTERDTGYTYDDYRGDESYRD